MSVRLLVFHVERFLTVASASGICMVVRVLTHQSTGKCELGLLASYSEIPFIHGGVAYLDILSWDKSFHGL